MNDFVALSTIATIASGRRPSVVSKEATSSLMVPVIGGGGASGYTSEALYDGNVLITGRVGTLGKLFAPEGLCWPSDNALVILPRSPGTDQRFLRYALQNRIAEALGMNRGAANPLITQTDLGRLELYHPALNEQRGIASILGALDDKIDLNRRMNETLEAMARAIFKDWFVDFGPTRAKMEGRAPYLAPDLWALFPERLDDEGKPEGWHYGTVAEIGRVICGKTPSTTVSEYYGGEIPFITIPDMHRNIFSLITSKTLSSKGAGSQVNKTLPSGSICVSCIATPGLVAITTRPSQTNQQINSVIPSSADETYYWYWVLKGLGEDIKQGGSGGSVLSNLSTGRFLTLKAFFASIDSRRAFHELTRPFLERIAGNEIEGLTLAATRDLLLPKLMSGEIRVKDAEKILEAAS